MVGKMFGPRKQRTRKHVIADRSVNHIESFIIDEGHTVQRIEKDYGYDLIMLTYDDEGYAEPGLVWFQVKAAETLQPVGSDYVFDLDIRDYNLWLLEEMPVILVLFDASRRRAFWTHVQGFFQEDPTRRPKKGARTVRVRIPQGQSLSRRAIARMRELKRRERSRVEGEEG